MRWQRRPVKLTFVDITDGDAVFARGMAAMSAADATLAVGASGVGHVVHRDDLVILA